MKKLALISLTMMLVVGLLVCGCAKPAPAPAPTPTTPAPTPTTAPEKPIELKYGTIYPNTAYHSIADIAWIEKISKDSNGLITVTPYWGATLVSRNDFFTELTKGVADLGFCQPMGGILGSMPLYTMWESLTWGVAEWQNVMALGKTVRTKFPQLDEEFKDVKIMGYNVVSNYQLLSNKPIKSAADFKGLKIKVIAGKLHFNALKEMGAEAIEMSMADVYVGLQKGTIDAAYIPYNAVASYKLDEVAKYITVLNIRGNYIPSRGMNWDSWNGLSKNQQDTLANNIDYWTSTLCEVAEKLDIDGIDYIKSKGMTISTLPTSELQKIYQIYDKAGATVAAEVDAKGLPGTDIFKAVRSEAVKYIK